MLIIIIFISYSSALSAHYGGTHMELPTVPYPLLSAPLHKFSDC